MVEIPLHSRVQSHASSLRPGGGGLSGFSNVNTVCKCKGVRKRTGKGEEGERYQGGGMGGGTVYQSNKVFYCFAF